jgi:hypothetical protein
MSKLFADKRTTLLAISAFVGAAALAFNAQFDADPETVAQWSMLVPMAVTTVTLIVSSFNSKA